MTARYDAVVIGAGHNGLTAAAYLARAGLSVLVLEQREVIGGATGTEEFHPGFRVDAFAHRLGPFSGQVLHDLRLARHGLEIVRPDPSWVALAGGRSLPFFNQPARTAQAIWSWSERDAGRWSGFCARIADAVRLVDALRRDPSPELVQPALTDLRRLARIGVMLRGRGARRMTETLRLLPMSLADLLDEWFESDALKGAIAGAALVGVMQGPRAPGTAYNLLDRLGADDTPPGGAALVRGGMGQLADALAAAARSRGAEIRTSATVDRIVVRSDAAVEVVLAGGEVISARRIVSNADPKRTFLRLVGAEALDPGFVRQVRNIRTRGVCAKVHLALADLPRFNGVGDAAKLRGVIAVAPSVDHLEHAYDDAKYGSVSQRPFLEAVIPSLADPELAPAGGHVMSVLVQYVPYTLKAGPWDAARRDALGDAVVKLLAEYAPNLPHAILDRQVLLPGDMEQRLGLTDGDLFHGQPVLDQWLFMRPVPGWARYRTPVEGLYLCGAGAHPGGGVTALPGYLAARAVLQDAGAS